MVCKFRQFQTQDSYLAMATTIKLDQAVMATKVAAEEVQLLPCTVETDVPST